MSQTVTINGTSYTFPNTGDTLWGDNVTNWAAAVSLHLLQKTGGTFTLSADVNFGASFGLLGLYYKTTSSNIASAGQFRLAVGDVLKWRNNANSADLALGLNGSDQLTYNSAVLITSTGTINASQVVITDGSANFITAAQLAVAKGGTGLASGTSGGILAFTGSTTLVSSAALTASQLIIGGGAGVAPSTLAAGSQYQSLVMGASNPGYGAVNLAQAAAITGALLVANGGTNSTTALNNNRVMKSSGGAVVEAAAITASRLLVSDANGIPTHSATTSTEVGYLSGVTSAIQTQLNAKQATSVAPTNQKFTSGSGTYTTPTSPAPLYIRVRMSGGGGGGGGSANASANATAGGTGANSTFGTTLLVANGGAGGGVAGGSGAGGAGGSASLGSGPIGIAVSGGGGEGITGLTTFSVGGGVSGANTLGGNGAAGPGGGAGSNGATNAGGGGGGAGSPSAGYTGAGGGAGGFVDAIITSPSATYAYAVGAVGTAGGAGTSGFAGGAGSAGLIVVDEYYQ